jgi:tripartite-type tricarboxylate transporter receptor subunit TctC
MVMRKFHKVVGLSVTAGLAAAVSMPSQPTLAADYYKGKTISIIVGRGAGGGTDTVARIFAKFLGKHIAGNPNVVVKNMPGAGGAKSMNFVYEKAKPDGRTIVYANLSAMQELLGAKGVRFKYGNFTWLGPIQGPPLMMFARTDVVPGGLKKPSDIIKAKKLILPGQRPTGGLDLMSRPTLDMMGLEYRYVPGYRGASGIRPAIRAGEGNIAAHGLNGWRSGVEPTMAKKGIVKALWYYPSKDANGKYVKSPLAPEMQTVIEVYKEAFGKEPSGIYWDALNLAMGFRATASNAFLAPPNTNKEATKAFRKGFTGMINDPAMISQMRKATGSVMTPVTIKTALAVYQNLKNVDPKLVKFWKDYNAEGSKAKKAPKDKRGGKRKKKK